MKTLKTYDGFATDEADDLVVEAISLMGESNSPTSRLTSKRGTRPYGSLGLKPDRLDLEEVIEGIKINKALLNVTYKPHQQKTLKLAVIYLLS